MAEQKTGAPLAPIRFDASTSAAAPQNESPAAPAAGSMSCAQCATAIGAYYYESGGAAYCARCKRTIEDSSASAAAAGGFGRGALYGLGAALLGALGYWAFIKITGFDWALVSIAVAAFVATATRAGSGGRGSRRLQVLAVALTYFAVGAAYAPLMIEGMRQGARQVASSTPAAGDSETGADAVATSDADDEDESSSAESATGAADSQAAAPRRSIPRLLGAVLLVALAGPILSVIAGGFPGSLINVAIIGFALRKAWQMSAATETEVSGHVFSGPYKVSAKGSEG